MKPNSEDSTVTADYEVALVHRAEERAAVFAIRMRVFVEEQAVPPEEELDALDVVATHFLVRQPDTSAGAVAGIIGTARLVDKGYQIGKIGRVAILREHRGQGVGARLMRFVEATACTQGFTCLVLDAQCYAIPFYTKLGYVVEGDVFLDANIEHRHMTKRIEKARAT